MFCDLAVAEITEISLLDQGSLFFRKGADRLFQLVAFLLQREGVVLFGRILWAPRQVFRFRAPDLADRVDLAIPCDREDPCRGAGAAVR